MVAKKKKTTKTKKSTKKKSPVVKKTTKKKATPVKKSAIKKTIEKKGPAAKGSGKKKISKKSAKSKSKTSSSLDQEIMIFLSNQPNSECSISLIQEKYDLSDEEVKKIVKRLENKNPPKISSKLIMDNSRWITKIKKIEDYGVEIKQKKKISLIWETSNDLPCFICPHIKKCSDGQEVFNPKTCAYLTDWLQSTLNSDEPFTGNPFHPDYSSKKSKSAANVEKEKLAAEKAEAEKVAAEKIAAEKVEAEKVAAEKTATPN